MFHFITGTQHIIYQVFIWKIDIETEGSCPAFELHFYTSSREMFSHFARSQAGAQSEDKGKVKVVNKKSMAGRSLRSRVIPDPETPPPPTRTTAVRGKGRGKGRPRKAATVIGKIQDALQTLLNQQEKSKSDGGREDSGMTSPPATVVGGGSRQTPPASGELPKSTHGCSYKTFVACKPLTYQGERDPVLALRWIEEIEMVFETCRCAVENKVAFARSMLKADALHWWNVETGARGTEAVRTMSWKRFVAKFRSQFCPLAATKKMEEEFLQLK
ncbi:hypothetical protein OSB04_024004 [Centaurea solstitialis]|uniref:Retrotransposon gag domain-containing protein n=1 Tax=Centaurea solstitialis TaxID=347529 RepID=A0AA38W077_9ASTR|nr:hypothetical protein OSB04_024004 [Centaurea solstitialis]